MQKWRHLCERARRNELASGKIETNRSRVHRMVERFSRNVNAVRPSGYPVLAIGNKYRLTATNSRFEIKRVKEVSRCQHSHPEIGGS